MMACVVQLGIGLAIASLGFLLGLHVRFSEGLSVTLAVVAGLLAVLALAGTGLGVWLGRALRQTPEREQDALRAAEEKVHHLARHDALTGLPNRGVFLERLCGAPAGGRRGDRMTAVLCLDLTDFKAVTIRSATPRATFCCAT